MAQHRKGHITASTIDPLLTGKGDKLLKGAETFCMDLALERSDLLVTDELNDHFQGNRHTEWGEMFEPEARKLYEQLNFVDVHSDQVVIREQDSWLSCTPDGLVGADGMIQIKCPSSERIFGSYLRNSNILLKEYADQCQFELMLSGRKWLDLFSYHPHFKEGNNYVTVRIEPDHEWQERTRDRIRQAEELITEIIKTLQRKTK